jgi:hypothetical protein
MEAVRREVNETAPIRMASSRLKLLPPVARSRPWSRSAGCWRGSLRMESEGECGPSKLGRGQIARRVASTSAVEVTADRWERTGTGACVEGSGCRPFTGLDARTGAGVRKPSGKEPAGGGCCRCGWLYGDCGGRRCGLAVLDLAACDEAVCSGQRWQMDLDRDGSDGCIW